MPSRIYLLLVNFCGKLVPKRLEPLWNHEAGPKTVFFWAPCVKGLLFMAGLGDFRRPAEKLSLYQSCALMLTGSIWARNSVVIIPKNWFLSWVNLCVFSIGFIQCSRIFHYRYTSKENYFSKQPVVAVMTAKSFYIAMSAIYRASMAVLDKFVPAKLQPMWNHPAGPKTVFFWAPLGKWCLVGAGLADMYRPPEKLSITQSSALALTGIVWSRYSLVITPRSWLLFAVNCFVGITGCIQIGRIINYRSSLTAVTSEESAKK